MHLRVGLPSGVGQCEVTNNPAALLQARPKASTNDDSRREKPTEVGGLTVIMLAQVLVIML